MGAENKAAAAGVGRWIGAHQQQGHFNLADHDNNGCPTGAGAVQYVLQCSVAGAPVVPSAPPRPTFNLTVSIACGVDVERVAVHNPNTLSPDVHAVAPVSSSAMRTCGISSPYSTNPPPIYRGSPQAVARARYAEWPILTKRVNAPGASNILSTACWKHAHRVRSRMTVERE